jgi:hypothetical protein
VENRRVIEVEMQFADDDCSAIRNSRGSRVVARPM